MTDTANFLVELGTEELPPKALLKLSDAFARGIAIELDDARLNYTAINAYATPRRLAVAVADLHGTDLALHLLTEVEVDGQHGIFCTPLN